MIELSGIQTIRFK